MSLIMCSMSTGVTLTGITTYAEAHRDGVAARAAWVGGPAGVVLGVALLLAVSAFLYRAGARREGAA